ncbi:YMR310C [Saccharomyces arboricola H-6]|uniref:YMR310C n=1 Tax=Saccharomyces arboricola (strain H-6 / AS 2.3317 / CBS 10644) TaxID=1160507 RepID=J8LPX0_SACAR|nr:YMR310C [Saccharomyces arboricola H-6]
MSGMKKFKKVEKPLSQTRHYSLCIPTTLVSDCCNLSQITHKIYQVAKFASLFNVSELVILENDSHVQTGASKKKISTAKLILALLQYFVTPPYLCNTVFNEKFKPYLIAASKLPRLSTLPFTRYQKQDHGRYREGLTIKMQKPTLTRKKTGKEFKQTKYINIGKPEALALQSQLVPINARVTIDTITRKIVSPQEAYGDFTGTDSLYGYYTRIASSFTDLFMKSPLKEGYTQSIYVPLATRETNIPALSSLPAIGTPSNILLVFSAWDTLERAFELDKDQFLECQGPQEFFDAQLPCPLPVSDVVDAIPMTLTTLSTLF